VVDRFLPYADAYPGNLRICAGHTRSPDRRRSIDVLVAKTPGTIVAGAVIKIRPIGVLEDGGPTAGGDENKIIARPDGPKLTNGRYAMSELRRQAGEFTLQADRLHFFRPLQGFWSRAKWANDTSAGATAAEARRFISRGDRGRRPRVRDKRDENDAA